MKRLMLAAPASGSGKTVLTCGLLAVLTARGIGAEAFKCGPDYIDPMFHQKVLGVPSRNLDLFLQGQSGVRATLDKQSRPVALIEGAMGYYDGVNGTDWASAWHLATTANLPVVLAVRPRGSSLTLAAQLQGLKNFRTNSRLRGVILTLCKPSLHAHLKPILERETGLTVLGYLPPMEAARIESRHLGLHTAGEIQDLTQRFARVAEQIEKTIDLEALLEIADEVPEVKKTQGRKRAKTCRIAVAQDEAFCFYYADNFDALEAAGAELVRFSPLHDETLPRADGLYLGGGYPELYAQALAENTGMRRAIRATVLGGLPTVAECGGFLYLQTTLQNAAGERHPMANCFPGEGYPTGQLRRFGYLTLTGEGDSLLVRAGEEIPAHEFHYWDTTANGSELQAHKPSGRSWRFGYADKSVYAAFPHLHFGGAFPLAERFAAAAKMYRERRKS